MSRLVTATLAAFLFAGCAANEEHAEGNNWDLDCANDPATNKPACVVGLGVALEQNMAYMLLFSANRFKGEPVVKLISMSPPCDRKTSTVRVGTHPAIKFLRPNGSNLAIAEKAADLVDQFMQGEAAGETALIRVYFGPDCKAKEGTMTLKGFTDAWNRLPKD